MKKSEKTKKKILDSTVELVAKKGYTATSTREIAEKAGVSEATIFKYYNNKDHLLTEIVEKTLNKFYDYSVNEALPRLLDNNKEKSVHTLIKELFTERLTFIDNHTKEIQVIFQEMLINEMVRKLFKNKIWSKMDEISSFLFERGKKEGSIKNVDNYFLQKALFGMLFYTITFEQILNIKKDKEYTIPEQAEKIIEILFEGIGNSK